MRKLLAVAPLAISLVLAPVALADHDPNQAPKNVVHRHFLKMYKVEKVLDIEGDEYRHDAETHVFCHDDDIVVDGMWKIVDVDQDDHGERPYTDVRVYASYNDELDPQKWHFEFDNRSEGRAQLKLYATCLGYKTEPNSHQHNWFLSEDWFSRSVDYDGTYVGKRESFESLGDDCAASPFDTADHILIAPGFRWTATSPSTTFGYGDIDTSRPFSSDLDDWQWRFWIVDPGKLTVSWRCLRIPSSNFSASGVFNHYHKILYRHVPSFPVAPATSHEKSKVETRTRACGQHEKGMLHAFELDNSKGHHLWFLGMDPRLKKRAYRIQNKDTVDHDSYLGLTCFNDRTSRRVRP